MRQFRPSGRTEAELFYSKSEALLSESVEEEPQKRTPSEGVSISSKRELRDKAQEAQKSCETSRVELRDGHMEAAGLSRQLSS